MNLIRIICVLIITLFSFSGHTRAQDWETLLEEGSKAWEKGNQKEALPLLKTALLEVEKAEGKTSLAYARVANELANVYRVKNDFEESRQLIEECLRIRAQKLGTSHFQYGYTLFGLAQLYRSLGQLASADSVFSLTRNIYENAAKPDSLRLANLYNAMGRLRRSQRRPQEAEAMLIKAKAIREKYLGRESLEYANTCNNLGLLYRERGRYPEAEALLNEAIAMMEAANYQGHPDYASFHNNLALIYNSQNRYPEAVAFYQKALEITEKIWGKKHTEYATMMNNLGRVYQNQGNVESAETCFLTSLDIREELFGKEHPDYASTCNKLGSFYRRQGRYGDSEKMFLKAAAIYEKFYTRESPNYASVANNLSVLYRTMGRYVEAENLLLFAVDYRLKHFGPDHEEYATATSNLASVYLSMGLYQEAEPLFIIVKNIDIKTFGKGHSYYAYDCFNLGQIYQSLNRLDEAEKWFGEALRVRENLVGKEHLDYAITLSALGRIHYRQKEYAQSEQNYVAALSILNKKVGPDHPQYAYGESGLAKVRIQQNRMAEADSLLQRAEETLLSSFGENHPHYIQIALEQARFYELKKEYTQAEAQYKKTLDLKMQEYRRNLVQSSEREQAAYLANNKFFFEDYLNFLISSAQAGYQADWGYTWQFRLQQKGFLLSNSQKMRQRILQGGDSLLKAQFQEWQLRKNQVARAYNLSNKNRERQNINLSQLQKQVNDLEKKLQSRSQDFAQSLDTRKLSRLEIQARMNKGEAALEMIRVPREQGPSAYLALLLKSEGEGIDYLVLNEANSLEGETYRKYRDQLQIPATIDSASYQRYWQSIALYCRENNLKKLYFSPDGIYHQISLSTLQNPQTTRFVLDEMEIHQVSYLKDLLRSPYAPPDNQGAKAVLLGNPVFSMSQETYQGFLDENKNQDVYRSDDQSQNLENMHWDALPGTETELRNIAQTMQSVNWKTRLILGTEAREQVLKQISNPRVLHLATHGFFLAAKKTDSTARNQNINAMYRSGLVLAGVENYFQAEESPAGDDGILSAVEASTLALDSTQLVVLSACETARGEVISGEGVYGLQRGFQVAGARNILMSLWKVKDVVAEEFMTRFYQQWFASGDLRQAFRQAQMELKEQYEENPEYWGAFVLIGN